MEAVRALPCLASEASVLLSLQDPSHVCFGKVRACHYDPWGDKGTSTKVSDNAAMPICDGGHAEQTDRLGWPLFEEKYNFDGRDIVTRYWLQWLDGTPMGLAWKRKMEAGGQ
jgi:hypothetical protein